MTPAPGDRGLRFVGDRVRFTLKDGAGRGPIPGWRGLLRTNIGRAEQLRREILEAHTHGLPLAGSSWRDLPMQQETDGWSLELPLVEVGYFKAKAYLVDPRGWQHWPEGPDAGISVHPDRYRTANVLYCAFPRMFGARSNAAVANKELSDEKLQALDQAGYTIIPPSGKLRDVTKQLPHIVNTLGCRLLHLLPVNPTPTTYARFGRYGSPYAALDLTAIDPALVVFDKRSTGVDQFCELTYAAHLQGARVFLDIVINHTGWGSRLQENRPDWFVRQKEGEFVSPGAWGVTWEDLVELKHTQVELWDELAEMLLIWCRRGVDGFRCDAGYKVPVAAWQYIVARVQQEFPETLFLLEGLGGAWEATEALLTEGGMQWAYSELFQNYNGLQVGGYLDHSLKQSRRVGLLVHYSETHDNDRLAKKGSAWSLLRNRLCGLTSSSGGFGFTCGVEWLAKEKIDVHGNADMAWGNSTNLVAELAQLNRLLTQHPCFFDGAQLSRLSSVDSSLFALRRQSQDGQDVVLVLVNTDLNNAQTLEINDAEILGNQSVSGETVPLEQVEKWVDLLGQTAPRTKRVTPGKSIWVLSPGAAYCLAPTATPRGLCGEAYRRARAQAAWGLWAVSRSVPAERIGQLEWQTLAQEVERSPADFLARICDFETGAGTEALFANWRPAKGSQAFPRIVRWGPADRNRVMPVPPGHWVLLEDRVPFRASLHTGAASQHSESIPVAGFHIACFAPRQDALEGRLVLQRYGDKEQQIEAAIRFLGPKGEIEWQSKGALKPTTVVLLTNGRGGMARMCVDLGRVLSKYDCVLGANLHPTLPVDRHIFAKRIRVWVNARGFISPLDFRSIVAFTPGPPAVWNFVANAGDGQTVEIQMTADMLNGHNATVFSFSRPSISEATGKQLPAEADVRLTVRIDIEDRNFHCETKRNGGADYHFSTNVRTLNTGARDGKQSSSAGKVGFAFVPAPDRGLRVFAEQGFYHAAGEWSENISHPVEQSRGQVGSGDAYSPGWFELPLAKGARVTLVVTADPKDPEAGDIERCSHLFGVPVQEKLTGELDFGKQLLRAVRAFVVQRDSGKTVVAGYPWFLDWGRDTLICARGLLAAGMVDEVKQLLVTFGNFEQKGTLPNTIHGADASNRDTTDAPLWFTLVCEEFAKISGPITAVRTPNGRTLSQVIESIARGYIAGTPNGIRMDPESALIWSPSHFTWMDTNYPAGTPREGYPIEIQALWIRLLRQLAGLPGLEHRSYWEELAQKALTSLDSLFWYEKGAYYADVLLAGRNQSAKHARVDEALRSNCLLVISLGLAGQERSRRCVIAARRFLVVPGALRSLAPLPVTLPLPVYGKDGHLLNNPSEPYWGHYEGDEDTRRKPAYHNGTAWTWTFPIFCEALANAWDFAPEAVAAARAYLGSMARLMSEGCLGHIAEILDGDAPHTLRGCDAQAWGATEALRVWKLLEGK